ncbi:MAG: MerR family transcriptional regulator [Phascolarctobacterium sp.]|nr:MerR family transcriptional regulator [Phascolarctobacterium sp.]
MIEKTSTTHFSAGEFARLFNVSKQTLFYYERHGVLVPEIREENGYRYYSLSQYYIFDIIINLRKLGLPLKDIAYYVKNRNLDDLMHIFNDKKTEYEKQLSLIQTNIETINTRVARLQAVKELQCDLIFVERQPEEHLAITPFIRQETLKKSVLQVAKHNYPFITDESFKDSLIGYIVTNDSIKKKAYKDIKYLCTKISSHDNSENVIVKESCTYLTISALHCFHTEYSEQIAKLVDYAKVNNLQLTGNLYIEQLRNYWSTNSPNDYVTKFSIKIAIKK